MRLLSRLLMPILLLLFSGTAALAQDAGWRVSEAKGNVIVIDASGERKAATGLAVAPGATVRTAARSTAVLVRGREFVTLRQNAQIRIPQATKERSLMQVIQDYGSALFNIGKQPDPHFGVQTPYLAAVVKGTTFVITVGPDGATLQVTEGAVEASTPDGGAREMILPGAVAMVAAGDTMRMVVEGDGRKVIDSPARPAGAAAATPASAAASSAGAARLELAAASENAANRVDEAIASSPGDVSRYSDGFASGEVAVIAAVVVSENTNRGGSPAFGSDSGRGNDGAVCFAGSCVGGGNTDDGAGEGRDDTDDGAANGADEGRDNADDGAANGAGGGRDNADDGAANGAGEGSDNADDGAANGAGGGRDNANDGAANGAGQGRDNADDGAANGAGGGRDNAGAGAANGAGGERDGRGGNAGNEPAPREPRGGR